MKLFPQVCVLFNFLCDVVIPAAVVFQDQSTSALALSMILLCHCLLGEKSINELLDRYHLIEK